MRALTTSALLAVALLCPTSASAARLVGVCGTDLCTSTEKGTEASLTTDGTTAAAYASPSLSADGTRLAYVKGGAPYLGGPNPASATKLLDTDEAREINLSADGKSFTVRTFGGRVTGSGYQLESAVFIGGAAGSARYGSTTDVHFAGWLANSPIASYDADGATGGRICPFPVIPSSEPPPCAQTLVAAPAGQEFLGPVGSPNGKLIAVQINPPATSQASTVRLGVAPPGGGVPRLLTAKAGDHEPAFSPDSRQVAFTRGADTWVVPAAGGDAVRLASRLTDATWGGPPLGATLPASGRLALRGPKIVLRSRCRAAGGCHATVLTLRRGGKKVGTFRIPALDPGKRRTATTRVSRATIRAVRGAGRAGLRLKLSGRGVKSRTVRVRR